MKRYHIFLLMQLLGLLSVCPVVLSAPVAQPDEGNALVSSVMSERATVVCRTGEPVDVRFGCFSLSADSGSLLHDMDMHATVLPLGECAVLRSEMNNVTAGGEGVRLLPNGTHFSENSPARITLAYDPQRIPDNYGAEDIYTFCCEETGGQWYRLERIGIDTVAHTVTSLSTHFTDFANAIISLPELPESSAYVPTTLTDMPDPDPLHGIPMVQVNGLNSFGSPTGDNSGSASLTYPIVIPSGRHGLQPDVNLYYNSANGNGPLGVGWSIPMPNITVDTRWGVPRYDAMSETEAYLVNGEPIIQHNMFDNVLLLPHQESMFYLRSHETKRFWFRDARNATRVVRHGQYPNDYWWEVTTTSGITYYYGRLYDPNDTQHDVIDENSVLRDDRGNIGYWALTAVVDLYGNYILYQNTHPENNIYPAYIHYTGNSQTGTLPTYKIDLTWKGRTDTISDGRLGLLRLTERLLCHVGILYKDTVISSYYLNYEERSANNLWKSRLASIDKSDEPNALRDCNFLEIELPDYTEYAGSRTTFEYYDAPQSLFGSQHVLTSSTMGLSSSSSGGFSIGGTATAGIGFEPYVTRYSAGGNFDFSMDYGGMNCMLFDLNGDGLPDLVYQNGNSVKYRRQKADMTGFDNEVTVSGLKRLSREVSQTYSWGLQLSFVGHLHYSRPTTFSYTDHFFSDINADGMPDMVTPDGILFNHLTPQGHPSFTPYTNSSVVLQDNSGCPEAGIHYNGIVDDRLECDVFEVAVDSIPFNELHPGTGWTEPNDFNPVYYQEDGVLNADNWHALPTDNPNGSAREETGYIPAAGISGVSDSSSSTNEDSVTPIAGANKSGHVPHDRAGFYEPGYTYRVERGKIIKYGIETICHDDNPDPRIETVRVWVAENIDTIQSVSSIVTLRQENSFSRRNSRKADGVRCIIQYNHNNQQNGSRFTSTQVTMMHTDTIAADDYNPKTYTSSPFIVYPGDIILFRLCSGDNATFDDVDWNITITYRDSQGLHQANAAQDYICTGNRSFTAPLDGDVIVRYKAENNYSIPLSLSFAGMTNPAVTLAANSSTNGAYVTFGTKHLQQGDTIKPIVGNANTVWSQVHIHPEIEFRYQYTDTVHNHTIQDTAFFYPDVDYPCTVINTDSVYRILFGKLHKGWGRFAYRPRNNSDTLDLCSLVNTERRAQLHAAQNNSALQSFTLPTDSNTCAQQMQTIADSLITSQQLYNPLADSITWIPVWPDSRTERWIPYGNLGYICQTGQSNSRDLYFSQESNRVTQRMEAYGVDAADTIPYYDSAIPVADNSSGGKNKMIFKSTKSVHNSLSFGVLFLSEFISEGTYSVTTDFIDLNGDGFPDLVGSSGVQYSKPWGGLGELKPAGIDSHSSFNSSSGIGFSASVDLIKSLKGNSVNNPGFTLDGSGGNAGFNIGYNQTDRSFVDMNGDGLPDIVSVVANTVRYNLGYRFSAPMPLPSVTNFNVSTGHSLNASLGGTIDGAMHAVLPPGMESAMNNGLPSNKFAIEQYSLSGGLDLGEFNNITDVQLSDMNGDGLPDLVQRGTNNVLYVAYNKGNSFEPFTSLNFQTSGLNSISVKAGLNVSGTLGLACGAYKLCFGIGGSGYGQWTFTRSEFIDMNADGLPDHVIYEGNQIKVCYNQSAKANILKCVTNPTGHKIHLKYELSAPSQQHRQRHWVLDTIADEDAATPWAARQLIRTTRDYDSAFYDNHERTDYGYARVLTKESAIRVTEEKYSNLSFARKGQKTEDVVKDNQGQKYIGHRFTNDYCEGSGYISDWTCEDIKLYPCGEAIYTDYYERQNVPQITSRIRKRYDTRYNLVEYYDDGDLAVSGDEWHRTVTYMPTTYKNLVALPIADSVMFGGGHLLRLRYATWLNTGKLYQMCAIDPNTSVNAMTSLFYDNYGNLNLCYFPKNDNGERASCHILYDYDLNALPIKISNQFDEQKQIKYNPRWGLPVSVIAPDNAEITYQYDYMGRLTQVLAPKERNAHMLNGWYPSDNNKLPYTVRYSYTNINHNLANLTRWTLDHTYVTKEMITEHEIMPMTEVTIYSARGEQLQKKKRTEVNGSIVNLTNGVLDIDALGRVNRSMYPCVSSTALWEYDDGGSSTGGHPTFHWYDVLDRNVLTQLPDGELINTYYNITPDCNNALRFAKSIKDPLYNVTTTYTSPQGWITSTEMADGSTTCYEYNCIGELFKVTDADGYLTKYTYDGFGQQIMREHPDAGITRWRYDATGNIACSQTANQYVSSDSTTYHYYFGRLMEIHHTLRPWENVTLTYDMAGRLALREDRTGSERMWYDELGNVRQTSRRIITPADQVAFCFMTRYNYDSFGRIREITYPDGENVNYSYYVDGGNLYQVQGAQVKVTNIRHDELEHITQKDYLNGCVTHYGYDSDRQWLTHIKTTSVNDGNTIFQYLSYDYDAVGNIINIRQEQNQWHGMGGTYRDDYFYDNRYRLAQNLHDDGYTGTTLYDMTYSRTSRIGSKQSIHPSLGYPDLVYGYDNSVHTHQPRVIHDNNSNEHMQLYWDANGNLRQLQSKSGNTRFHLWDDDNMLLLSVGPKSCGYYGNASDGKRAYKLAGTYDVSYINGQYVEGTALFDNAVLYPNPYMTVSNKCYTKHYFMGSERFCTTIGGGNNGNWLINPIDDLTTDEKRLLADLKDNYTYQYYYNDCFDYPHHFHHTANTDYTGTIVPADGHYPDYQYNGDEMYYGKTNLLFYASLYDAIHNFYHHDKDDEPFYYHSDHLGSAAWITDKNGLPVQYIMYAPYGEELLNQHAGTYDERFTFTGKERDIETGYDYFGARNYLSALSIWGAVDPLADKYIHNSPYVYCDGNPIKYVDPNGEEKHNMMNPDSEDIGQCNLFDGAVNLPDHTDNSHIFFISHGSSTAMYPYDSKVPMTAEGFVAYLSENSDVWRNTEDKSSITIVLVSCETAKGVNPIAQKISELLPETKVVAPTEFVWAFSDGMNTSIDGTSQTDYWYDIFDSSCSGKWITYINGLIIDTSRDGGMYNLYK